MRNIFVGGSAGFDTQMMKTQKEGVLRVSCAAYKKHPFVIDAGER